MSCECKDAWVYYPKQFGQNQGMTFKGCDPIAPDNSGTTWCYLEGGESAASCAGATQASNITGDQHYWATCTPSAADLARVATNAGAITAKDLCASSRLQCEAESQTLINNCSDCMTDSSQAKCLLKNQDISWNNVLRGKLGGNMQSCAVLGSYLTNAPAPA